MHTGFSYISKGSSPPRGEFQFSPASQRYLSPSPSSFQEGRLASGGDDGSRQRGRVSPKDPLHSIYLPPAPSPPMRRRKRPTRPPRPPFLSRTSSLSLHHKNKGWQLRPNPSLQTQDLSFLSIPPPVLIESRPKGERGKEGSGKNRKGIERTFLSSFSPYHYQFPIKCFVGFCRGSRREEEEGLGGLGKEEEKTKEEKVFSLRKSRTNVGRASPLLRPVCRQRKPEGGKLNISPFSLSFPFIRCQGRAGRRREEEEN